MGHQQIHLLSYNKLVWTVKGRERQELNLTVLRRLKKTSIGGQRRQWHPTPVLLPGKSHCQRSLVGCSPWGRQESDTTERLHFHFSLSCTGEGNGNPLQCSWLEHPRDGGAWWAAVYGVAQSRTRLKWLSSSSSCIGGKAGNSLRTVLQKDNETEYSRHWEQLRYSGGKVGAKKPQKPLESKKATWSLWEVGWRVQRAGTETKGFQGPNWSGLSMIHQEH